jgi:D-amino-acid oxidase
MTTIHHALGSTAGRALVVGAGVSGLTSALCLARLGVEVDIVAEKFDSDLVSVVAGALWEWPPAGCGYHRNQKSLERSKTWAQESYEIFSDLARDPPTGVFMRRANFYFTSEQTARELHKMNELAPKVRGFVHDSGLAEANGIDPAYGVIDAYAHLAPMIDTDRYMGWLRRQVEAVGVTITQRRIEGRLADHEAALLAEFRADAIVNATGLGAVVTHGRPMYPLRGALVRAINDGSRIPKVEHAAGRRSQASLRTRTEGIRATPPRLRERLLVLVMFVTKLSARARPAMPCQRAIRPLIDEGRGQVRRRCEPIAC